MLSAESREQLVIEIDQQVEDILSKDGEDTDLLLSFVDRIDEIYYLMDETPTDEFDRYCEEYEGFCVLIVFLEELASAIHGGSIGFSSFH